MDNCLNEDIKDSSLFHFTGQENQLTIAYTVANIVV